MSEQDDVIDMVYRLKARGDGDYAALVRRIIAERDAARAACKAFLSDVVGAGDNMTLSQTAIDMLMRNVERMQDALNGGPNVN